MSGRRRLSPQAQGRLWFAGSLIYLSTMFATTYYVSSWLIAVFRLTLPGVVIQIMNSLGGLTLMVLSVLIVTRLFGARMQRGEHTIFAPIIEALDRIAKGDFSARVDPDLVRRPQDSNWFGSLANSVNSMAMQLNKMEMMRQEFISNVSHELQSPLTSIQGFARALHNDSLSAGQRDHYLSIIEAESTRLSRITENLMRLAALEGDQANLNPKPYRLDKQIRTLILACEPQWTAKHIDMDAALDEVTITGDEDLLSQVWLNLLHNSIKFTPDGGRIEIALRQEGDRVTFCVTDTGIGISEEDQARIFERFYKADKSRSHASNQGSGLGLSIVHKIVALHHGAVEVTSQLGEGARFTINLPV